MISAQRDVVLSKFDFRRTQTSNAKSRRNIHPTSSVITVSPITDESMKIRDKSTSIETTRTSQHHRLPPVRHGIDEYVAAAETQAIKDLSNTS